MESMIFGYSQPNALQDSMQDARQARGLDASLPEANSALATASLFRGDWGDAETSFRRALARHPLMRGSWGR